MLSIPSTQFKRLGDNVRDNAHQRMVAHVQLHFPRPARLAGAAAVQRLVDGCFDEAKPLGLHSERDLTFLLSLKLYFGAGFRQDRQCEAFASILARDDVATPEARMSRAWQDGMAHHDEIAGEQGQHLDAAILRLAGRGASRIAADDSPLDSAKAEALLAEIWPEKFSWMVLHDRAGPGALMAQVSTLAQAHGVATRGAARLILLLCWVFGSGFASDPMLAPLGRLLAGEEALNRAALAEADAFLARITEPGA